MDEPVSSDFLTATEIFHIPFYDLDPTGMVWHGHYFKYFECARSKLFESIHYNYEQMKNSGVLWPVVDTNVRYVRPLLLNQEIKVTASLKEWELRLVVDYKVLDDKGRTCTKARTVQVPVDAETMKLQFGSPEILVKNVRERLLASKPGK